MLSILKNNKLIFNSCKALVYNHYVYESSSVNVDFTNSKIAFRAKSSWELIRSVIVIKMCTIRFLVDNNKQILEMVHKILGTKLFEYIMRKTFYGHFVAGENENEIKQLIKLYRKYGIKSILDYSVEEDVSEDKAKKLARNSMKAVLDQDTTAPNAISVQFQPSLEFAKRSDHVIGARTYYFTSEEQCDKNAEIIKKCIDVSANTTPTGEGFTAVKLTALGPPQLLMHMSDILNQLQKIFQIISAKQHNLEEGSVDLSFDLNNFLQRLDEMKIEISYDEKLRWFTLLDVNEDSHIDLFEWLNLKNFEYNIAKLFRVKDPKTGEVVQLIKPLSEEGIVSMRRMLHRLDGIIQHAKTKGIRVMIDAEQTYLQPAISRIALELMRRYNKDRCVVFNTYQTYLKESLSQVNHDLHFSQKDNFYFGAKLVRGAYMEQERERAKVKNYDDPICINFDETTKMYNSCIDKVICSVKSRHKGAVLIMIASHNSDTVKYALKKCEENKIKPEDRVICFGQLLGMCDRLSFNLGNSGYSVYKYMPYGPISEVLPYLSRRAQENGSVLNSNTEEMELIISEIKRRIKSRDWFSYPENIDNLT